MLPENYKNLGVLIRDPDPTDYIAGATSPLTIVEVNPEGDNRPYKPDEEHQSGSGGDKMNCVTVSSGGDIETNLNLFLIKGVASGLIQQVHIDWLNKWKFIGPDGRVKISTRWAAIQNGTTPQGNYGQDVAYWWRKNGFIPEWMLPNDQTMDWKQYYDTSCLTDEMRQCAKESLQFFEIQYEWIIGAVDESRKALKRGAVQILTAVCPGWSQGDKTPIPACNLNVQHATELLFIEPDNKHDIWDSYDPHNKQFAADYPVPFRMLYMVKPIKQEITINKNAMIAIKEIGKPAVYLQAGTKLIPFATTWENFKAEFPDAQVIEVSSGEIAKLTKSGLKITK